MRKTLCALLGFTFLFGCKISKIEKDEVMINRLWKLELLENKKLPKNLLKPLHLTIDIEVPSYYGDDSCNSLSGSIEKLTENEIVFGMGISTKMMCRDMRVARKYVGLLKEVETYEIKNSKLYLYNDNKEAVLIYKK